MFKLSCGDFSYQFAHDPQTYQYNPKPRTNVTQTVGGQVVQLLGFSIDMAFTGQISQAGRDRAQLAAEAQAFNLFFAQCLQNQRQGMAVHLICTKYKLNQDVILQSLSFSQAVDTNCYPYSLTCTGIRYGKITQSNAFNDLWEKMKNQIGFQDPGGGWHGGQSTGEITQIKLSKITGFPGFTSASSSSSSSSSASSAPVAGSKTMDPSQAQAYAKSILPKYGLNPAQFEDLVKLWTRESSWNMHAENASSGAYGIPQADPDGGQGVANSASYRNNAMVQIQWGLQYIKERYGSIAAAWAHEVEVGWY